MLLPTDVICGGAPPSIEFQNIPFVTGTSGRLDPTRYPTSGGARDPGFYVWLQGTTEGLTCPDGVTVLQPRAEGTYEIVIGGEVGDEVEIAIHDATFDLPDGRTFVIDEGVWHFVLVAPQTRP